MRTIFDFLEDTSPYRKLKYGLNEELNAFFDKEILAGRSQLKVAELACGSGFGAHLLAQHPSIAKSYAVDISRTLHDQCNFKEFDAEFIEADLFKMPLEKESLDLAWNSSSIEHFPDTQKAIQAMADVVRPGGYVYVGVPYLWGPLMMYYLTPTHAAREWLGKPFTLQKLSYYFKQCGLEPAANRVYFFRFFVGILAKKK